MDSFKHSCPFCGQHIEYTVGYCGKQMQCPMCGQTVTFPAVPPRQTGSNYRVKNTSDKPAPKGKSPMPKVLTSLRDFQYWNVVGQIAIPFVIIAVLLGGAFFVKNKLGAPSSDDGGAPTVQADPQAWQKMTELTKAEREVQAAVTVLDQANSQLESEQLYRKRANSSDALQQRAAEQKVERAQNNVKLARKQFDAAENKYRQLGGTIDFRSQLRKY